MPLPNRLVNVALACLLGTLSACGPGPSVEPEAAIETATEPTITPEPAAGDDKPRDVKTVAWVRSFADAVEQAKAAKMLVMIDFTTDWCGWCKRLDADTYTDHEVIKLTEQVVPVKLDAEKEGAPLVEKYLTEPGFPTIVFLDPRSSGVVGVIKGYLPPKPFAEEVRTILQTFEEFAALHDRLQANPDDLEAIGELAWIAVRRDDFRRALELVDQGEAIDPKNTKRHLTRAYLALGDSFQARNIADEAALLFDKAAESGQTPEQVAYARLSLAECYRSLGKNAEALATLEALTAMPDAPSKDKDEARRRLNQAKPSRP
ncbi:MAG: thioredoxin family protein [Isosphaeraceae bacterium]